MEHHAKRQGQYKHQIVVPSEVRRDLGIEAGDRLDVQVADGAIVLRRRPDRPSTAFGVWRPTVAGTAGCRHLRA